TETNATTASLDQLRLEEDRLLEAYRRGILSATLLGQELEKLNTRRAPLEERQGAVSKKLDRRGIDDIKESLRNYCGQAANRVNQFNFVQRQQFLRLLIKSIVFEA